MEGQFDEKLAANFTEKKPDHQILNTAYQVAMEHPERLTILVTKDVNLRVKAKAVGLMSQDYKNDHVSDVQRLYTGSRIIDHIDDELITEMYKPPYEFAADQLNAHPPLTPNEYPNPPKRT